ncbi:MAG: dihydroneopterin aldolase [Bacteroidetes bacterium]|nr:MAG: dihydroneopterin aldolase [Bacteroidota bacterium]
MVKIELKGLEFFAYHGVYSEEQKSGNDFLIDLCVEGDFEKAVQNDDLAGTIDYEALYELIAIEMQTPSKLLEHVVGRILDQVVARYAEIKAITVAIEKLNPPIKGKCKATRVTISKEI